MIGAVHARHGTRIVELVERPLLEADRERPERLRALLRRKRCERGGIDPARQEHTHRNVADEMRADRVAQPAAQLSERYWSGPRVALHLHAPGLPDEQVAGRQLAALVEDRERCRDRVEGEEGLETVEVELAARQRSQLRR